MLRLRTVQGINEQEYRSTYFMDFAPLQARLEQFQAHIAELERYAWPVMTSSRARILYMHRGGSIIKTLLPIPRDH